MYGGPLAYWCMVKVVQVVNNNWERKHDVLDKMGGRVFVFWGGGDLKKTKLKGGLMLQICFFGGGETWQNVEGVVPFFLGGGG